MQTDILYPHEQAPTVRKELPLEICKIVSTPDVSLLYSCNF